MARSSNQRRSCDGAPFSISVPQNFVIVVPPHDAAVIFLQTIATNAGIKALRIAPDEPSRSFVDDDYSITTT